MTATPEWVAAQDPARWLTARERALCDAAASARRRAERRAGRLAVKRLLHETFGASPLSYEIGTDGLAPVLIGWTDVPEITISLSHSAGLGAASWAWAEAEGSVGVDAQHIRPAHPGLAARVLTPAERAQAAQRPGRLASVLGAQGGGDQGTAAGLGPRSARDRRDAGRAGDEQGTARIAVAGEADMAAVVRASGGLVGRAGGRRPSPSLEPVGAGLSAPEHGDADDSEDEAEQSQQIGLRTESCWPSTRRRARRRRRRPRARRSPAAPGRRAGRRSACRAGPPAAGPPAPSPAPHGAAGGAGRSPREPAGRRRVPRPG